ncbi:MAG: trypsin-like peptidase domain-containing protein [Halobacteriovoraceae bacterium]|nr:trypsin-like peptidase domain-containing protein [Halobacteriovoraceae bacterium]
MKLQALITCFIFSHALLAFYGENDSKIIPFTEIHSKELAVASLISRSKLVENEQYFTSKKYLPSLKDRFQVCESETSIFPYLNYTSLSDCSGVLVDHNKLITVSHCLEKKLASVCDPQNPSHFWIFDYISYGEEYFSKYLFLKENVFTCNKIIKRFGHIVLLEVTPMIGKNYKKFLRTSHILTDKVYSIGHSFGLAKMSTGKVKVERELIEEGSRAYGVYMNVSIGASGSPVFNEDDEIIGLIWRGKNDFGPLKYYPGEGICRKFNTCNEAGQNCSYGSEFELSIERVLSLDKFHDQFLATHFDD